MRLRLVSDIHEDFWYSKAPSPDMYPHLPAVAQAKTRKGRRAALLDAITFGDFDAMAICGDLSTGLRTSRAVYDIATRIGGRPLVVVLGNHDLYVHARRAVLEDLERVASALPNVHVLVPGEAEILGVHFVGASLWYAHASQGGPAQSWVEFDGIRHVPIHWSDGRNIPDFDAWHAKSHEEEQRFLEERATPSSVVLTHFLPHALAVHERWRGNPENRFFVTPNRVIGSAKAPRLWLHGHSHERLDVQIGQTRVVANPCGYPNQRRWTRFDPTLTLDIP